MNVIKFPKLFSGSTTVVDTNINSASLQSLHLLVSSEAGTLFGDPEFGVMIRKFFFDQNNYVLRDILIDELYTKIVTFCPFIFLDRKNIVIKQNENKLYAQIYCKNKIDFEMNMYELVLFNSDEEVA